jgi:hypothetical protein
MLCLLYSCMLSLALYFSHGVTQVDTLAHHLQPSGANLQPLMATWALSAAVAGGADAVISSVVYVEAATLGPAYTHVSAAAANLMPCGVVAGLISCMPTLVSCAE